MDKITQIGIALMILIIPCQIVKAENAWNISMEISVNKDSELGMGMQAVMSKALEKIGYSLSVEYYPPQRGIEEIRRGRMDGSLGRVMTLNSYYGMSDIIRVDVPLAFLTLSLWCNQPKEVLVALKRLRVAIYHGSAISSRLIGMVDDPSSIEMFDISKYHSLVHMLGSRRLDCFLGSEETMQTHGVGPEDTAQFYRYDLVTTPIYPWLHKRYAHSKSELEKELLAYKHPESWKRKFLRPKHACKGRINLVCPDGRLFKKEFFYTAEL